MKSISDIFRSYGVLDSEGRHINGCDKMTNHNYGDAYELLFRSTELQEVKITEYRTELMHIPTSTRNDVKLMMEVGVADGSSLLAWRDIFPNALCVGLDIHPAQRLHNEKRVEFYLGNQRSQHDCETAAAGRMFDLIVEDATHQLEDTLLTMFWLWPFVRQDGMYIVEEFANIGALQRNVVQMWPNVEIVNTQGPFGGNEPLIVFRKSI